MKKQILTVILLVICIVSAFSQTTELNRMKYDFYRMNLLTKFMFFSDDGMKQGSCQPMESLRSERDGGKTAYWADGCHGICPPADGGGHSFGLFHAKGAASGTAGVCPAGFNGRDLLERPSGMQRLLSAGRCSRIHGF